MPEKRHCPCQYTVCLRQLDKLTTISQVPTWCSTPGDLLPIRVLPLGTALNVVYSEVVVQETLDRGAFGEVCRSTWRGNDVAVKVVCTPPLLLTPSEIAHIILIVNGQRKRGVARKRDNASIPHSNYY